MALRIYTANRLGDGVVVFMDKDGGWAEAIADSRVIAADDEAAETAELADAAEADSIVVGPYLIDVTDEEGDIRPVSYRERIRAYGPSIHPDFAKKTVSGHFDPVSGGGRPVS